MTYAQPRANRQFHEKPHASFDFGKLTLGSNGHPSIEQIEHNVATTGVVELFTNLGGAVINYDQDGL